MYFEFANSTGESYKNDWDENTKEGKFYVEGDTIADDYYGVEIIGTKNETINNYNDVSAWYVIDTDAIKATSVN